MQTPEMALWKMATSRGCRSVDEGSDWAEETQDKVDVTLALHNWALVNCIYLQGFWLGSLLLVKIHENKRMDQCKVICCTLYFILLMCIHSAQCYFLEFFDNTCQLSMAGIHQKLMLLSLLVTFPTLQASIELVWLQLLINLNIWRQATRTVNCLQRISVSYHSPRIL